jgi:DNA-binding CsgD family transcriptional regulator
VAAGAETDAAELLAISLLLTERAEQALDALDGVDGADTLRATVAFWGLGRTDAADGLAAAAPSADRSCRTALEALMRLHLAELIPARKLAGAVLDEPGDRVGSAIASCAMALLAAVGGEPDRSADLLAEIPDDRPGLTRAAPALQYALPVAVGTRAALALDLAGIDEIVAAEFAALSRTRGFGFGAGWAALLQAHGAWLRGRTGEALHAAEEACAALAACRYYDGAAHAARAYAAALRGDTAVATESMAIAESAGDSIAPLFYPWRVQARAWVTASTGDLPGAVHLLSDLLVRLRMDGLAGHELLVLHDLVRLGRADLAVGPMAGLLVTVPGGRAAPLLHRHAKAAAGASPDALFAVAREFAGHGYLLYAAEAAAGAVRLFRAARDPQALAASTLLADVLSRCDTLDTPALHAVQPSLTSRERQVAELAAVGTRSRDIAERLYLSPRTVENHLQRVYSKLGVNGRTELAPALRSLPQ